MIDHPHQRISDDEHGTSRFEKNAIVNRLLEDGPYDLNDIACWHEIPRRDRRQFAQLIGYSVDGYHELSYVNEDADGENVYRYGTQFMTIEQTIVTWIDRLGLPASRVFVDGTGEEDNVNLFVSQLARSGVSARVSRVVCDVPLPLNPDPTILAHTSSEG